MDKWFLLDNDKNKNNVIGPFDLNEAQKLIDDNPFLYAWQPSYTHWTPVNQISQFSIEAKIPKPPGKVPEELMEAFVEDERQLISELDTLGETLSPLTEDATETASEFSRYNKLTQSLNEEIKTAIANIEKQYAALQQNLVSATKSKIV
jgi:hypothetical protein